MPITIAVARNTHDPAERRETGFEGWVEFDVEGCGMVYSKWR
jgi:hypothetical protein